MADAQRKKVLLVDDDGFFRKLYQKKAEKYPLEFRVADSGVAALELLRSGTFTPDKILLDINMPDMDGVEVLRTIRTEHLVPNAKVFILSNTNESEYAQDYQKLKIDRFIPKTSLLPSQLFDSLIHNGTASATARA
ncbi:MAG: hypothetical protein AMXMBFR44_1650 [Candidatus Campbellbacteria bacterium]